MRYRKFYSILSRVFVVLVICIVLIIPIVAIKASSVGSTVATSLVSASGSDMPFQKRSFYATSLFWVFYFSGYGGSDGIAYKTSSDGLTWSDKTLVRASSGAANSWAVWFDGTYVSYSFTNGVDGGSMYYRKGTPQSDGTIDWLAVEQTAYTCAEGHFPFYSTISVDSTGKPWVGFIDFDGASTYIPTVTTSSTTNGTWTTADSFPYVLDAIGGSTWAVTPVPQTNGKVYVAFGTASAIIRGRQWSGTTWGDEENVGDSVLANCERYTAIADGDSIELVMTQATTNNILHYERVSAWVYKGIIESSASAAFPAISYDSTGVYYCFWEDSPSENHIGYKKYSNGAWGSLVDLVDESGDGIEANTHPLVSYRSDNNYITVSYLIGTDPNCTLKFYALDTYIAPDIPIIPSSNGSILLLLLIPIELAGIILVILTLRVNASGSVKDIIVTLSVAIFLIITFLVIYNMLDVFR